MSYIETHSVQHATILRMYSEKDEIDTAPEYQRGGGVWTPEKKKLLIDSIINKYDVPKIYFHQFSREEKKQTGKAYAIIDGKQRLEAIWDFIEGKFCLESDFLYQDNPEVKIGGLSYNDLSKQYPKIKINFDSFVLPIVGVQTDDLDLIEDMFSRLNEAAPLNAAEKRNAFGGDMVKAIRQLADHEFFQKKVKFKNNRYQHYEVAAKFLLIEASQHDNNRLVDTKKVFLDSMAKKYKKGKSELVNTYAKNAEKVLKSMTSCFSDNDQLLRAQGSMAVYYLIFKEHTNLKRAVFLNFDQVIRKNRREAESNYEKANYDYLEYERMSQQGTNDASSIKERARILGEYITETS